MRIVILDAFTTNPGDLDWAPVAALGDLTVHDRTPDEEIVARAAGAEAVLTNKTPVTAATVAALPALKYVGVLATGVNAAELAAAEDPERRAGQDRVALGTRASGRRHRHRSEVRSDQAVLSPFSSSRSTRAVCSAR